MAKLKEELENLQQATENPEDKFGAIYYDLQTIIALLTKVCKYFNAKGDHLGQPSNDEYDGDRKIVPLFKTLKEPSEFNVGHIINLGCGHTQQPTEIETIMFTSHL